MQRRFVLFNLRKAAYFLVEPIIHLVIIHGGDLSYEHGSLAGLSPELVVKSRYQRDAFTGD
jgi:hypothetical protein